MWLNGCWTPADARHYCVWLKCWKPSRLSWEAAPIYWRWPGGRTESRPPGQPSGQLVLGGLIFILDCRHRDVARAAGRAGGPLSAPYASEWGNMSNLAKALIGLAALAFVLAIVTHFRGPVVATQAEAYSRASTNLALLAIALVLTFGDRASSRRPL